MTHLLQRYEELVALHLAEKPRLRERFKEQGQIVLAIDGLQPDVGHEVRLPFCATVSLGKCSSREARFECV